MKNRKLAGVALVASSMIAAGGLAANQHLTQAASSPSTTVTATATKPTGGAAKDVSANLFEWNWASVAKECTGVLGPAGYASVQVAPPQDSTKVLASDGSDTVTHSWWEPYQPVDYSLTSRMGTEAQFQDMVKTCRGAGVKVYVDAVLNHMSGIGVTSYGGVKHSKYSYPGLYEAENFHSTASGCTQKATKSTDLAGSVANYADQAQVQDCELGSLPDLDTSQEHVRQKEAAYLNKLLSYGVSGFRVDAAKHIGHTDLAAIKGRLNATSDGTPADLDLEVTPGGTGELAPSAFEDEGKLLGFDYATALRNAFTGSGSGGLNGLKDLATAKGLLPSDKEVVFAQNHDTDREGTTLRTTDPQNTLAQQFMLAYGHGTPQVYSSFTWKTVDDSPPSTGSGMVTDTACGSGWTCTDAATGITGLVGFHNATAGQPVENWWHDGDDVIAFNRGKVGFFAANNTASARTVTVKTGLAAGTYRDRATGHDVTVDADGSAHLTLAAHGAAAFTTADRSDA